MLDRETTVNAKVKTGFCWKTLLGRTSGDGRRLSSPPRCGATQFQVACPVGSSDDATRDPTVHRTPTTTIATQRLPIKEQILKDTANLIPIPRSRGTVQRSAA